ncbi:hypothetical protein [Nocardia sp. NPDC046763]|uniref:LtfC-like domain-containing protein n=1 Tax=Nocardia sp. NPDC046763 TaxID=3155256 RepID=UPI0033FE6267
MAPIVAGQTPTHLIVVLNPGSFWSFTVNSSNPNGTAYMWPVGSTAKINLVNNDVTPAFSVTWAGAITGSQIVFTATATQCDAVPDGSMCELYTDASGNGTQPMLQMSGRVVRRS